MAENIFELDISGIDKFERKVLEKAKNIAFPLAIKGTLNTLAFESQKGSRKTIREEFENRNKFTERSIRVEPVKTLKISDMVSTVGSIAPHMEKQEEGATETSSGKHGLRIPTGAAAGQAQLYPRGGVVRKTFRHGKIRLANKQGRIKAGKNEKRFILMSIRVAGLRGQSPFVFLPFRGRKSGIYKVVPSGPPPAKRYKRGGKSYSRSFKWGRPRGTPGREKLILIHSHADRKITIPATFQLRRNTEKAVGTMSVVFKKEADRIFDRLVK